VILFGSVHLLPPGLDWQPPQLRDALARADEVWFEIPNDDAANLAAQQASLATGLQPQGHTLSDDLQPADRTRLAMAARACGLPVEGLDHLKPWLADVTLSVASYRLAGARLSDGVERQLAAEVPASAQRRAFETPAEQVGYLAGAAIPDQVASLRETLGEVEEGPAGYQRLVQAWLDGDAGAISKEALQPMMREAPAIYRALVVERNQRWTQVIAARLAGSGRAVVIVGVGHLVGPDSVPALLRARGVVVERLSTGSDAAAH
jgi:uncharacterized protein YbaP (TraB family)